MVKKFNFDWNATKNKIKQEETQQKKSFGDDRFWKLEIDKATKKGSAIIRFLPDAEGTFWKKYFSHWFTYLDANGKKKYYTKKCATTINGECPICEKNFELYDSPYDSDNDLGKQRKRKTHYVANVQVLKDPAHKENNGKVKLFDFGPQIYDIYHLALFGKEFTEDEKAEAKEMEVELDEGVKIVPADFKDGANFFYRSDLKSEEGKRKWNTYESSKFQDTSNICPGLEGDEWYDTIAEIMEKTVLLDEFVDPKSFPLYETVRNELKDILGGSDGETTEDRPVADKNMVESLNDGPEVETSEDPELETLGEGVEIVDQEDQEFIDALALDN